MSQNQCYVNAPHENKYFECHIKVKRSSDAVYNPVSYTHLTLPTKLEV